MEVLYISLLVWSPVVWLWLYLFSEFWRLWLDAVGCASPECGVITAQYYLSIERTSGLFASCADRRLHGGSVSVLLSWSDSNNTLLCFPSQSISSREERDDLVRSSSHTPSNKAQILAMPQFGLRDNLIRCELLKNEDLYTYLEDFRYRTSFYFKTSLKALSLVLRCCCVHLSCALAGWIFWSNKLSALSNNIFSLHLLLYSVDYITIFYSWVICVSNYSFYFLL